MSRHEIPGLTPELEVVVGWDNPLQTFFAQVLQPGDEDDDILLWLGTSWEEHPTPESLVGLLAPYARIDTGLLAECAGTSPRLPSSGRRSCSATSKTLFNPSPRG